MDMETIIRKLQDALENAENDGKIYAGIRRPVVFDTIVLLKEKQEEIVRCKDCIYWEKGYSEECGNSDSVCFHNGWCKPNWFCADGERH